MVTWVAYDEFIILNTACFRQFTMLLMLVSQFQTISAHRFVSITADFILPSTVMTVYTVLLPLSSLY